MNILISNDDGYDAPGLICLHRFLKQIAEDISVFAPDRNKSGASHSLTLHLPLTVKNRGDSVYSIDGTPTDCVHLALTGLMTKTPDIVISGINDAANLGDDTIYSGTVAAAMEARFLGITSIAVSLASKNRQPRHFETAAQVVADLIQKIRLHPLQNPCVLNVNVPDIPYQEICGTKITRLGFRHKTEKLIKSKAPNDPSRDLYWIGPAGKVSNEDDDTDFYAVKKGFVSITPLSSDLTNYGQISMVDSFINQ